MGRRRGDHDGPPRARRPAGPARTARRCSPEDRRCRRRPRPRSGRRAAPALDLAARPGTGASPAANDRGRPAAPAPGPNPPPPRRARRAQPRPGPSPAAAPSDAPGVTDTEITLGTISSLSGPVPGLGASALAGRPGLRRLPQLDRRRVRAPARAADRRRRHRQRPPPGARQRAEPPGARPRRRARRRRRRQRRRRRPSSRCPWSPPPSRTRSRTPPTVFDINPPFADVNAVIGKYRYLVRAGRAHRRARLPGRRPDPLGDPRASRSPRWRPPASRSCTSRSCR